MEFLSEDLIFFIVMKIKNCKDLSSLRLSSKIFNSSVLSIYYKARKLEDKMEHTNKNYKRRICIRSDCGERERAVGRTNIFYLQHDVKISLLMDYIMRKDPSFYGLETYNIFIPNCQLKKGNRERNIKYEKCVQRIIPYCFRCMNYYVPYGNREDPLLLKY